MPAENFSLKASVVAGTVKPEKFVRPDLSRTEIQCYGLVGRKRIGVASYSLIDDYEITSMIGIIYGIK